MTTINIISDPYKKNIEFKILNTSTNEWELINKENNHDSKLISNSIRTGFLPYKIKEIVDLIKKEYAVPNEQIKIIFEGAEDEYQEISSVCKNYEDIILEQSSLYLENASSILPRIIEIFNEIKPIVDENIHDKTNRNNIEKDIEKLVDASNDIIPICVLGNYSSGKSTFINALMGIEILPSGDMPVTSKIYKIKQLNSEDASIIKFEYNNEPVTIKITNNNISVESNATCKLIDSIKTIQNAMPNVELAEIINSCLDTINKTREGVSDLINIEVPFAKSPLSECQKSFVIFDTPGSNAATHKDHFSILEGAMKNLSNGIPIYVAEYHTLDSCDNEVLYEKIKGISQIDDRFTMIIVNKADKANIEDVSFDEKMESDILRQAVPKNLYSGGIYFVSSFMGMGAKNQGKFINKYSAREYAKNHIDYEDETSEWYQELYKYNIMPNQLKDHIIQISKQSDNKILANSGLLAVEHEIVNFAEKYSAYDKCKQSNKYIGFIIDATQREIESVQTRREELQKALEKELDDDKATLKRNVEQKGKSLAYEFSQKYPEHMADCYKSETFRFNEDEIRSLEKEIKSIMQDDVNYSLKQANFRKSFNSIFSNIADDVKSKNISNVVKTIGDDVKTTVNNAQILAKSKLESDKATVNELLQAISDHFNYQGDIAAKNIDNYSRRYWEHKSNELKESLSILVANSPTLDNDKKQELASIIINYEDITFGDKHIFEKRDFEKSLNVFGRTISLNKINIRKLTEHYNRYFAEGIHKVAEGLKYGHMESFETWRIKLEAVITKNIVNYSPKLSDQAQKIEEQRIIIESLKQTRKNLEDYNKQIQSLMDWKIN